MVQAAWQTHGLFQSIACSSVELRSEIAFGVFDRVGLWDCVIL